jgi:geranylgeranyl pyrophosphate synthase
MATRSGEFLEYWRATRAELDTAFTHCLPTFFAGLPSAELEAIAHALNDGKRLRGCLLCLVGDTLGGRRADAWPRAMAIECILSASLIHDDFVDGDARRRGRAAAWTVHGPRRAVLLGDLMFATALQRMVETSRDDGVAVAGAIATMANGAWREPSTVAELEAMRDHPNHVRALYPRIIHLKTGVLFGTAARLGASAAAAAAPARRPPQAVRRGGGGGV